MFASKPLTLLVLFALGLQSARAHAGVQPPLGAKGALTLTRDDVERPSDAKPCGGVDVLKSVDGSAVLKVDDKGAFKAVAENFNG
jgi:hypothetical protein